MKIKSIILTVVAIAMSFGATAQVADLQEYAPGKAVTKTYEPQYIGCDGERVVMVEATGRRKNKIELVAYSMDQAEMGRVLITDDKDLRCYGGFINGTHIDLLMGEWHGEDMKLYRDRRNLQTMQPEGEQLVLTDYKANGNDELGFRLASSPDQNLLAIMYYVARESQMTEVQIALYSRELEEYWRVDVRARGTKFFSVTDNGEVILGGRTGKKIEMTVADGETEKDYSIDHSEVITNIAEIMLARYANGKFYFIATNHDTKGLGWAATGTLVDRVVSLCYDTKSKRLTSDTHEFTQEEHNRLINAKDDAKLYKDDKRVTFCSLNQALADDKGYYAMLDQTWTLSVNGVTNAKYRQGQMVIRVNNDGKVDWVKTFRISCEAAAGSFSMINHTWVKTDKGPMLLWVESKSKKEMPIDKPAKDFKVLNHAGTLTAARIDKNGNIVRQQYPIDSKTGLQGRPSKMETGDWLVILRGKTKGHFGKLTVK